MTRRGAQNQSAWLVQASRTSSRKAKLEGRPKTQTFQPLRTADVVPLLLELVDMTYNQCRYPYDAISGNGFLFCGHPRQDGSSYCAAHHNLCWRPVPPKRERTFTPTPGQKALPSITRQCDMCQRSFRPRNRMNRTCSESCATVRRNRSKGARKAVAEETAA